MSSGLWLGSSIGKTRHLHQLRFGMQLGEKPEGKAFFCALADGHVKEIIEMGLERNQEMMMLERIAQYETTFPGTLELASGIGTHRTLRTVPEGNKTREKA